MKNFYSVIIKIIPKFIKLYLKDIYYVFTGNYNRKLKGNKREYLQIFDEIKAKKYDQIDDFINSKNLREINTNFINELALISQVSIKKSEVNYQHGRLIYSVLDDYLNKQIKDHNKFFYWCGNCKSFSSVIISKCAEDNKIDYSILVLTSFHTIKRFFGIL